MTPGFRAIESAMAACILDGLMQAQAAEALGVSESRVQKLTRRLRDRFKARSLGHLTRDLRAIADPELYPARKGWRG